MRRGGIQAESRRREEEDYIEYVVRIPKSAATAQAQKPAMALAK